MLKGATNHLAHEALKVVKASEASSVGTGRELTAHAGLLPAPPHLSGKYLADLEAQREWGPVAPAARCKGVGGRT